MISFRSVVESDFPLLFEWLQLPHIKEWWDDRDDTLEKVRAHYSRDPEETKRFILLYSDSETEPPSPSGYFQYYIQPDEVIGIDQFLADPAVLNRGIGTETISAFADLIKKLHAPTAIIVDPEPENKRAIRCYEKVGFQYQATIIGKDGKPAYLMRIETGV
jgi:RimJ/RimL family protein N-acetyltransferase